MFKQRNVIFRLTTEIYKEREKKKKQFREQNIYVFIFCLKIVDNVKNIIRYYYTLYI